jgi:predicted PurR-regulated permease PerM
MHGLLTQRVISSTDAMSRHVTPGSRKHRNALDRIDKKVTNVDNLQTERQIASAEAVNTGQSATPFVGSALTASIYPITIFAKLLDVRRWRLPMSY